MPVRLAWTLALSLLLFASVPASEPGITHGYIEKVPGTLAQSDALLRATRYGELDEVERLIASGADVNAWTVTGRTPLNNAVRRGDLAWVRLLVDSGAIVTHQPYGWKESALHEAARYDLAEAIPLLVAAGADVNGIDRNGETPLHSAVWTNKSLAMIQEFLAHGADVNLENRDGETPLENAIFDTVDIDVVKALIGAGSRPLRAGRQRPAHYALERALFNGRADLARLLLDFGCPAGPEDELAGVGYYIALLEGDDDTALEELGDTATIARTDSAARRYRLYLAAKHGRIRVAEALLEAGVPPRYVDWVGRDPVGVAAFYGKREMVRLLLERGASRDGTRAMAMGDAATSTTSSGLP